MDSNEIVVPDFPDFDPRLSCRAWLFADADKNEDGADESTDQLSFDHIAVDTRLRLCSINREIWVPGNAMKAVCTKGGRGASKAATMIPVGPPPPSLTRNWTQIDYETQKAWMVKSADIIKDDEGIQRGLINHTEPVMSTEQPTLEGANFNYFPGKPVRGLKPTYKRLWDNPPQFWEPKEAALHGATITNLAEQDANEPHESPLKSCSCGIYSRKTFDLLHDEQYTTHPVIGTIKIWGRMIEGTTGYRAQYAYPEKLYIVKENVSLNNLKDFHIYSIEDIQEALTEAYKVPVEITETVTECRDKLSAHAKWD